MADKNVDPAVIDGVINKLKDIEGVYKSLVEKMTKLQFETEELGLSSVSGKLGKPAGEAPNNAKLIGDLVQELEQEKQ